MERPKFGFNLSFEYEQEERRGPFIESNDVATIFSERFDIATRGWIYHPALVIYSFQFSPEWEQERRKFKVADKLNKTTESIAGYLTQFTFLQYKPFTLTLIGSRDTSTLRSSFTERSRTVTDNYDAIMALKYRILPTTVRYNHQEKKQTGFFKTSSRLDQLDLDIRHDQYLGSTSLHGTFRDSTHTTKGSRNDIYHLSGSLNNSYEFTEHISMASDLYYEETDSTDILLRKYNVVERLNMRHSRNFSTYYTLRYQKDNQFDKLSLSPFRSQSKSAGFGLSHLLYENLYTTIDTDSEQSNDITGRNSTHSASVNWNYVRDIPKGSINLNAGYDYLIVDRQLRETENSTILVRDEEIILQEGEITLLVNENIDRSSIRITEMRSVDGFGIEYKEGINYDIVELGSFTRIIRRPIQPAPPDNLDEDVTVFVEYRYTPRPAFDYETLSQFYGIKFNLFSAWSIYYRFLRSQQDVINGPPPDELFSRSTHSAGTSFEWKWSKSLFEWEDSYSTQAPTEEWLVREIISLWLKRNLFLQLMADYKHTLFKDTEDIERSSTLSSVLHMKLSPRSNLKLTGFVADTSGDNQNFTNSEISALYQWLYRIWGINIEYKFRNEEDKRIGETIRNHYFLMEVKRHLF